MSILSVLAVLTISASSPAVALLGYDPEAPYVSECDTRDSTARLVTVTVLGEKPLPERLTSYLHIAGLNGAAKGACPAGHAALALPKGPVKNVVWDVPSCAAAAEAVWGKSLKAHIDDIKLKAHPDIAAGFADGVAAAIAPIRAACDPHPSFAKLEVGLRQFKSEADSMRRLRGCLLWRAAANKEYDVAKKLGETKGRAAGLEHLNGPAMLATAQSKIVCEATAKAGGYVDMSAFQVATMALVKTAIEAMPETPSR